MSALTISYKGAPILELDEPADKTLTTAGKYCESDIAVHFEGGGAAFAAIAVTYPVGAVCTCSNGSKALTAKDTSGAWLFVVPSGGEWTITATNGTNTVSKTTTVVYNDVKTVAIVFALYLIKDGVASEMLKPLASGYKSFYGTIRGQIDTTSRPGEYGVIAREVGGGNGAYYYVGTEQLVDLSEFKKLHAVVSKTSASGWGWPPQYDSLYICVSQDKNLNNGISQAIQRTITSDTEYVLDVSSVQSGYIDLLSYCWFSAAPTTFYVKDFYLTVD